MFKKLINRILNGKQTPYSFLALSMDAFTNETHLEQIHRQGRWYEFKTK